MAQERFTMFRPHVVVGFGGWLAVPVVLAARQRRIPVLLHEQNVRLGRANQFLLPWASQMALSFPACAAPSTTNGGAAGREPTPAQLNGTPGVVTGLPIRHTVGTADRGDAARGFGLEPQLLTVFVLGGSQGSRAINRLVCAMLGELSWPERLTWQFIHLTGPHDPAMVQQAYAALSLRCWVAPSLANVADAYALADVVIARAGGSTIAELACVGTPAVLIPYPHARGHQRANAQHVEAIGAGVLLEEARATPQRLRDAVRRLLSDARLRHLMGTQMQTLARPDATQQLASAVVTLARTHAQR
jgi:UDP-N-acetylglucosamine--N-acetylmuramyl-(pentapeptide) pyrophosphoryl-undecaprenol N-acetylglucosamine transferase